MSVILNPAEGWAQLGSTRVSIQHTGHNGALQIDGEQGPCLTPVSFMERSRLTGYASVSRQPSQALAKLIVEASLLSAQQTTHDIDPLVVSIIALALAGANENNMPSFAESILLISQQSGWTPQQLGLSHAAEIDRLARQLAPELDDGWVKLRFNRSADDDLNLLQQELADNLLLRLHCSHDSLPSAIASVDLAKNPVPNRFASSGQFSDQQQQSSNDDNGLQQAVEIRLPVSPEPFGFNAATPAAKTAALAGDTVSQSPANARQYQISLQAHSLESAKKSASNTPGFPANAEMDAFPPGDTVVEPAPGLQSFKKSPMVEQLKLSARATPQRPVLGSNQLDSIGRLFAPAVDAGMTSPVPPAGSSSLFLSGASPRLFNGVSKLAHFEDAMTNADRMPKQLPRSVNSSNPSEIELDDLLDELATRLHLEADMRGIDR